MLTTVGRYFIVLIDKRGHTNAPVNGSVRDGGLCAKLGARDHAHKSTTRTTSAALAC